MIDDDDVRPGRRLGVAALKRKPSQERHCKHADTDPARPPTSSHSWSGSGVVRSLSDPSAPFASTTPRWVELLLKRVVWEQRVLPDARSLLET